MERLLSRITKPFQMRIQKKREISYFMKRYVELGKAASKGENTHVLESEAKELHLLSQEFVVNRPAAEMLAKTTSKLSRVHLSLMVGCALKAMGVIAPVISIALLALQHYPGAVVFFVIGAVAISMRFLNLKLNIRPAKNMLREFTIYATANQSVSAIIDAAKKYFIEIACYGEAKGKSGI